MFGEPLYFGRKCVLEKSGRAAVASVESLYHYELADASASLCGFIRLVRKDNLMKASIYIGPSIPGLSCNTVFSGDLPPHIKDLIEKKPAIAGLIVPLRDLQESRRALRKSGHILCTHYQTLLKKEK